MPERTVHVQVICRGAGCGVPYRTRVRHGTTRCPECGEPRWIPRDQAWEGPTGALAASRARAEAVTDRDPVDMACLGCGTTWTTRAEAGHTVRCPGCGKPRKVPRGARRPAGWTPTRTTRTEPVRVQAPERLDRTEPERPRTRTEPRPKPAPVVRTAPERVRTPDRNRTEPRPKPNRTTRTEPERVQIPNGIRPGEIRTRNSSRGMCEVYLPGEPLCTMAGDDRFTYHPTPGERYVMCHPHFLRVKQFDPERVTFHRLSPAAQIPGRFVVGAGPRVGMVAPGPTPSGPTVSDRAQLSGAGMRTWPSPLPGRCALTGTGLRGLMACPGRAEYRWRLTSGALIEVCAKHANQLRDAGI